jgi:uncharacterized protein
MKSIIFASTHESAGKTSIIAGLMKSLDKKIGYIKPFGDRLIYKWKKSWDYDSSVITDIFKLTEEPDSITLGFDHSKLRYVYDEESLNQKFDKMVYNASLDKDLLFIEGGKDIFYGSSLNLDSISIAKVTDSKLIFIVSGEDDTILDDLKFISKYFNLESINFGGIIINKVNDIDEFENIYLEIIEEMRIEILGIIPYKEQLTYYTVKYLADKFFAKVIAGDKGLDALIKNIFVGAMSTDESLRNPLFNKSNKFLVTSGDRSDMILAALESDTVGILLTNNILPPNNIISKAEEKNIPLLLIAADTFDAARQIDKLEALLMKDDENRLNMLSNIITKYIKKEKILEF